MTDRRADEKTPVNVLWDQILMLSIYGIVDSARAQDIMEGMLSKIIATNAKIIILDILEAPLVDSAVANHIIKITKATRLVGAETVISGMSPQIAQTLVNLGIELGNIVTTATLADAVRYAFEKTGYIIKKAV